MSIHSRTRTTIWLGLGHSNEHPQPYDVHSEDDMLMIETSQGQNEIEVLISPDLFPMIKEVIERYEKGVKEDVQH